MLLVEFTKLVGLGPPNAEKLESEKNRTLRRAFLYKHAERISRWVFTFDPSGAGVDSLGGLEDHLMSLVGELRYNAISKAHSFHHEVPMSFFNIDENTFLMS